MWCHIMKGDPQKNYHLKGKRLGVQVSPTRWVLWEPTCITVPAGGVVRGCVRFGELFVCLVFWKTLSMCLPISWWVIYQCTCPHCTDCSAIFDQKYHDPHIPPSLFTGSHPRWLLFGYPGWKKFSKGNTLPWRRDERKNGRITKRDQNQWVQNCSEQW